MASERNLLNRCGSTPFCKTLDSLGEKHNRPSVDYRRGDSESKTSFARTISLSFFPWNRGAHSTKGIFVSVEVNSCQNVES